MKKEQFLLLYQGNPEEVFKLVVTMGETISAFMVQVETLNKQQVEQFPKQLISEYAS